MRISLPLGFFGRSSRGARRRHHHAAAGSGFDAVGVLEVLAELDGVLEGEASELVSEFIDRHGKLLSFRAIRGFAYRVAWSCTREVSELFRSLSREAQ